METMKKYLYFTFILTGVFLTKSCCLGPAAVEKTIDYGLLSDTLKAYLPYEDSSFISFLDTDNVVQEYLEFICGMKKKKDLLSNIDSHEQSVNIMSSLYMSHIAQSSSQKLCVQICGTPPNAR